MRQSDARHFEQRSEMLFYILGRSRKSRNLSKVQQVPGGRAREVIGKVNRRSGLERTDFVPENVSCYPIERFRWWSGSEEHGVFTELK